MSKEQATLQLLKVFRRYGYEGATLTRLSQATGLGKASLYHYFPKGKEEMAQAVFDYMNDWMETNILTTLRSPGEPAVRIGAMTNKVDELYDGGDRTCLLAVILMRIPLKDTCDRHHRKVHQLYDGGDRTCLLAVFSLGSPLFRTQIQQALTAWIDSLAQVLVDAGFEPESAHHKAEDAIIQIQGSLILARGLDNPAPFKRVLQHLSTELLSI